MRISKVVEQLQAFDPSGPQTMLSSKSRQGSIHEVELVVGSSHAPHHSTRACIDLDDLVQVSEREQQVTVGVEIERVSVCPVNWISCSVLTVDVLQVNLDMIERRPVE